MTTAIEEEHDDLDNEEKKVAPSRKGKSEETDSPNKTEKTSNPTYPPEDSHTTYFTIFFFAYALATIVSFALILAFADDKETRNVANCVYYIALIIYQMAVIFVSYWSHSQLKKLPTYSDKPAKTWYELVFYAKFFCCSLFNLIAGILLIYGVFRERDGNAVTNNMKPIWILMATTYLINVISIPFPGIVLFEYLKIKDSIRSASSPVSIAASRKVSNMSSPLLSPRSNNHDQEIQSQQEIPLKRSRASSQLSHTTETSHVTEQLDVGKNVFNDKFMLAGISCAYFIHFLGYILIPAVAEQDFDEMLNVMYIDNDEYDMLYTINHVVLRTFKGMSLNGLFFIFFVSIIAKDQERYPKNVNRKSDWEYVKLLLHSHSKFWVFLFVFIIFVCVLDVIGQDLVQAFGDKDDKMIHDVIDVIWICIHGIGIAITIIYINLFKGAYKKYTKPFFDTFREGKIIDNISYGLKAFLLFIFFMVQVICLLDAGNELDWGRMLSMLGFGAFQMVTLVQLRSIQCNDEYIKWCKKCHKFNNKSIKIKRESSLKWVYFRFLIFVNISDLLFVYVYGEQYYGQSQLGDNRLSISYAMSFSSGAIFTICVSQLIISYAEFDYLLTKPRDNSIEMSQDGKAKTRSDGDEISKIVDAKV